MMQIRYPGPSAVHRVPGLSRTHGIVHTISRLGLSLLITVGALQACGGGGNATDDSRVNATASSRILDELSRQQSLFAIAGNIGGPGFIDAVGSSARFNLPQGVAVAADGSVYVADRGNHVIRRIAPEGAVSTVAGKPGTPGSADGKAADARFSELHYLAADADGNLYASDGNSIRKIGRDGMVSTLAGLADAPGSIDGPGNAARFDRPAGIAIGGAGDLYIADQGNHTIRRIGADGTVSTVAGAPGQPGSADGAGPSARLNSPQGIAFDRAGVLYVADRDNYIIRRIGADGNVTTVAGSPGIKGSTDGMGAAAQFFAPQSVAVDDAGNLYVADAFLFPRMCLCDANGLIRRVAPDGTVSTLAGTSKVFGSADGTGPAARFNYPLGIAVAPDGNLYVADTANHTVRRVTRAGAVTTLAGTASAAGTVDGNALSALFEDPLGIAADGNGNLYIADADPVPDQGNAVIRKWNAGTVSTFAGIPGVTGTGYADGAGLEARFDFPQSVATDSGGNVYVADTRNGVIRKITPSGMVSTLAGQARSYGSIDGTGAAARFEGPSAIAVDVAGNLYVADVRHNMNGTDSATIRKVTPGGAVTTLAGAVGLGGDADGAGANARFTQPQGIAVDRQGTVYVTDAARHTVRRITASGLVSTLAGNAGVAGHADGAGASALFRGPRGIAVDARGDIYVADTLNNMVRRIAGDGTVATVAGTYGMEGILPGALPGALYRPQGVTVVQDGMLAVTSARGIVGLKLR